MNWSIYTADRATHLKIVVVGLAAALLIAVIGISARELNLGVDIMTAQNPAVIKAGGAVVFTDRTLNVFSVSPPATRRAAKAARFVVKWPNRRKRLTTPDMKSRLNRWSAC